MYIDTQYRLHFRNAQEAFEHFYDEIIKHGDDHKDTKALYNIGFYLAKPRERIISTEWRKWSYKYAEREWQWYLSQNRSVKEIKKFAPIWDKMH